jgi:AcrR family transcriptional regulator
MKESFSKLPAEKREKIVRACLLEFGAREYGKAALDRIVESAGISKGGLYEYISSKEELYLYIVELSYSRLYEHLQGNLDEAGAALPSDILERFALVSRAAVDFYVEHPEMIGIIANSSRIDDASISGKARSIFDSHFDAIFEGAGARGLAFPKARLVELLKWMSVKTRSDFLAAMASGRDIPTVVSGYIDERDFLLAVLGKGIYAEAAP